MIDDLANGCRLEERFQDHLPQVVNKGTQDCHIEPDWIMTDAVPDDRLLLVRTGSHAELFW